MAFHIKNRETEALARKVAALKGAGLTETVHEALRNELARELRRPSVVEAGLELVRALRAKAGPGAGLKVDKAFRDSLYERD